MLGKQVRLKRLFNRKSGKMLVVALDHAIAWGVMPGLDRIKATMEMVVEARPDAVILTKGIAEKVFRPYAGEIALIMKCSIPSPYHPGYDTKIGDVNEAIRLGADAIAVGCSVCDEHQAECVRQMAMVARDADTAGLPSVVHIYPNGNLISKDDWYREEHVKYAARVGAECNIDIVKTFYTGDPESFSRVIEATPAPIVVAGGPTLRDPNDIFQRTYDAMAAGAAGVAYGRNVWQAKDMVSAIKGLAHIIHENGTVEEALKIAKSG